METMSPVSSARGMKVFGADETELGIFEAEERFDAKDAAVDEEESAAGRGISNS